jgi:hypothetical protein
MTPLYATPLELYEEGSRLLDYGYNLAVAKLDHKKQPKRPFNPDDPKHRRWETETIADAGTLERRLQHPQTVGLGIVTTGLAVIDPDQKPGQNGRANLEAFVADGHPLPERPMQTSTMGGGLHIYFREPAGLVVTNSGGELGGVGGVDVRGRGGFVVVPPTSGGERCYRWLRGPVPLQELACGPEWLTGPMSGNGHRRDVRTEWAPKDTDWGQDRVAELVRKVSGTAPAQNGNTGRHASLIKAATAGGHLVAEGLISPEWVLEALTVACGPAAEGGNGMVSEGRTREVALTIRDGITNGLEMHAEGISSLIEEVARW